jgi:hypothetical protein
MVLLLHGFTQIYTGKIGPADFLHNKLDMRLWLRGTPYHRLAREYTRNQFLP